MGTTDNPIDIFNYKNPLDPTYEIDGLDSVLATVELPHQMEIQGFMKFADRLSRSGYLLRLKTYMGGWDMPYSILNIRRNALTGKTLIPWKL